jgi:diaminopimelate decarboxylase
MLNYKGDALYMEDASIEEIAKKIATPFYAYSNKILTGNYVDFSNAITNISNTICYSIKANNNLAVVKTFAALGSGADIVSAGEMYVAMKAGIAPGKIVFSGVGKTPQELETAIKNKILQINAESEAEIDAINEISLRLGIKANVALRVNPDVDAKTHAKITTGKKENKFGIAWDETKSLYLKMSKMKGINIAGIATHIGSQLLDLESFRLAFTKLAEMVEELERAGITLANIDVGGGLGINYNNELPPTKTEYAKVILETLGKLNKHIITEPGRALVGEGGILVTKVVFTKKTASKNFIIVDAGMNDLVRPAMYDSWHTIKPVCRRGAPLQVVDIVGPICESSDVFAKNRSIEQAEKGDLLAIFCAGAYGSSMSSTYNFRPLAPELMVNGAQITVTRPRITYEEMLRGQILPTWL